ncbi:hypothetical protein AB0L82_35400 [Nocardia sp. NPDC052001]|uniref:hypothetical protein n=1 Tax=Nocardia sp. NPDC052001 TaxID=3154853 RepID=UPI00341CA4DD
MADNAFDTSGLLRYRIWILVQTPEWEDAVSFNAYSAALPRTGERLTFSGSFGQEPEVQVTEVEHHWRRHDSTGSASPSFTVAAEVIENGAEWAVRMVEDRDALTAWLSGFPYLEPVDYTTEV